MKSLGWRTARRGARFSFPPQLSSTTIFITSLFTLLSPQRHTAFGFVIATPPPPSRLSEPNASHHHSINTTKTTGSTTPPPLSPRADPAFNPTPYDPGYPLTPILALAQILPSHSWEYGTAIHALLEVYTPKASVFNSPNSNSPEPSSPFPVPSLDVQDTLALRYAYAHITLGSGADVLARGEGATGDPASLGVGAVLLGAGKWDAGYLASTSSETETEEVMKGRYWDAAGREVEYLLGGALRMPNGAVSMRVEGAEVWADFMFMAPPFLAYYAAATSNTSVLQESVRQCALYRDLLQPSDQRGLWRHIVGPFNADPGLWSTGNGWAVAGMVRVLATVMRAPLGMFPGEADSASALKRRALKTKVDTALGEREFKCVTRGSNVGAGGGCSGGGGEGSDGDGGGVTGGRGAAVSWESKPAGGVGGRRSVALRDERTAGVLEAVRLDTGDVDRVSERQDQDADDDEEEEEVDEDMLSDALGDLMDSVASAQRASIANVLVEDPASYSAWLANSPGSSPQSRATLTEILTGFIAEILDAIVDANLDEGLVRNYVDDVGNDDGKGFGEVSGSALIASAVYRMAVLLPEQFGVPKYVQWAEGIRRTLGTRDGSGGYVHVKEDGTVVPTVNPLAWGDGKPWTEGSPEGQCFVVLMYAAWRDCVDAGVCEV